MRKNKIMKEWKKRKNSAVSTHQLGERTVQTLHRCGNRRWKKPRKILNPYPSRSALKFYLKNRG